MGVTESHEATGSWDVALTGVIPREILDHIDYFGHVAIIPGRVNAKEYGDNILNASRYVGVLRNIKYSDDGETNLVMDDTGLEGVGMNFWLGDDNGKGDVLEDFVTFTNSSFENAITTLAPDSVSIGHLYSTPGSYGGQHVYETPRSAIQYVCDTMSNVGLAIYDTFNRSNSSTSLGNLDSTTTTHTDTWTQKSGTWGIATNAAYISASGTSVATVPVAARFDAQLTVEVIGSGNAYMVFRYTDANNYWRMGASASGSAVVIEKVVSGVVTTLATSDQLMQNSTTMRIVTLGDYVYGYINGDLFMQVLDTFNNTATLIGMKCSATNTRFETFSAVPQTGPVSWRVNNDGTLDAGPEDALYVTTPTCVVVRKGLTYGEDLHMQALPTHLTIAQDVEDFATRVLMLAESTSTGDSLATGSADIDHVSPGRNTYKDLFGNSLKLTQIVSESDTVTSNADVRAELALRQVIDYKRSVELSTDDYDVYGSFEIGDYIYLYDPDSNFIDPTQEVTVRGVRLNPVKLQVVEMNWPVTADYSVGYRAANGTWYDLTDYVAFEDAQPTTIVVGDPPRLLTTTSETVSTRLSTLTLPDNTVPNAPTWAVASWQTTANVDSNGNVHSTQLLVWNTPTNVDGSPVVDGDRYEIQYKLNNSGLYSQTWGAVDTLAWSALAQWDQPVAASATIYQTMFVSWGQNSVSITDLSPGTEYDFRIRAIDQGDNTSAWSTVESGITMVDNVPPTAPAAPTVAASIMAIQVTSELGKASGGSFNLEQDLAHLEIHVSHNPSFSPEPDTLVGQLKANKGMLNSNTPAVGTFDVVDTTAIYIKIVAVDTSGNASLPSAAAIVTALLVDDEHISNLTVSKLTSGTITSDWLLGASIKTANQGARIELDMAGLRAYNSVGGKTVDISTAAGSVDLTGSVSSANYEEALTGWRIDASGTTQFQNLNSLGPVTGTEGYFTQLYMGGIAVPSRADLDDFHQVKFPCVKLQMANAWAASSTANLDTRMDWDTKTFERNSPSANAMANVTDRPSRLYAPEAGVYVLSYNIQWANPDGTTAYHTTINVGKNTNGSAPLAANRIHSDKDAAPAGLRTTNKGTLDIEMNAGDYIELFANSTAGKAVGVANDQNGVWVSLRMVSSVKGDSWVDGDDGLPSNAKSVYFYPTGNHNYINNGSSRSPADNARMYHGFYDQTAGHQKCQVGFNYSAIQSALSGKTVVGCTVRFTVQFSLNSYMHVQIGTHNNTGFETNFETGGVHQLLRVSYNFAYKGGTYTADLGADIGDEFRTGSTKGLVFGPGPSQNSLYYGYLYGYSTGTSIRPKLTFYYV